MEEISAQLSEMEGVVGAMGDATDVQLLRMLEKLTVLRNEMRRLSTDYGGDEACRAVMENVLPRIETMYDRVDSEVQSRLGDVVFFTVDVM